MSYDGHGGYDFAVPIGTPVYASDIGIVEAEPDAGNAEGLHCPSSGVACLKEGRMRIRHPYGLSSWSQHLSRQVGGLKVGDRVLKGALIGYSGKTSAANIGPHLHYEVRMDDGSVEL